MKKLALMTFVACIAISAVAFARVEVEIAFDPAVAVPGDQITLFTHIANLGDVDAVADLEVSVAFMGYEFGPFVGGLPLAAGEDLSYELAFIAPPVPSGGTLTITVTATINGFSDTTIASLTLNVPLGAAGDMGGIADLGPEIIRQLNQVTPTAQKSLGEIKAIYR